MNTSFRGKLHCIINKVRDHLMYTITVTNDMTNRKVIIKYQFHLSFRFHAHRADNIFTQQIYIYISISKFKRTSLNLW